MSISDITLGEKIRFYRKRAGLSQFGLEIEAGMTPGAICRIEKDNVNPSKETIFRIAAVLELTPLEIVDLFAIDLPELQFISRLRAQEE